MATSRTVLACKARVIRDALYESQMQTQVTVKWMFWAHGSKIMKEWYGEVTRRIEHLQFSSDDVIHAEINALHTLLCQSMPSLRGGRVGIKWYSVLTARMEALLAEQSIVFLPSLTADAFTEYVQGQYQRQLLQQQQQGIERVENTVSDATRVYDDDAITMPDETGFGSGSGSEEFGGGPMGTDGQGPGTGLARERVDGAMDVEQRQKEQGAEERLFGFVSPFSDTEGAEVYEEEEEEEEVPVERYAKRTRVATNKYGFGAEVEAEAASHLKRKKVNDSNDDASTSSSSAVSLPEDVFDSDEFEFEKEDKADANTDAESGVDGRGRGGGSRSGSESDSGDDADGEVAALKAGGVAWLMEAIVQKYVHESGGVSGGGGSSGGGGAGGELCRWSGGSTGDDDGDAGACSSAGGGNGGSSSPSVDGGDGENEDGGGGGDRDRDHTSPHVVAHGMVGLHRLGQLAGSLLADTDTSDNGYGYRAHHHMRADWVALGPLGVTTLGRGDDREGGGERLRRRFGQGGRGGPHSGQSPMGSAGAGEARSRSRGALNTHSGTLSSDARRGGFWNASSQQGSGSGSGGGQQGQPTIEQFDKHRNVAISFLQGDKVVAMYGGGKHWYDLLINPLVKTLTEIDTVT